MASIFIGWLLDGWLGFSGMADSERISTFV